MKNFLRTQVLKRFFRGYIVSIQVPLSKRLIHIDGMTLNLAIDLGALAADDPDWIDIEIVHDIPKGLRN